jgi:arabinofuranan 3-O-arabinosyltransferase
VPAGAAGTVTLEFATDGWYRLGIFGGLLLLIPLTFLALRRGRVDGDSPPLPWQSRVLAWAALVTAVAVTAGVAGIVATVVVAATAEFLRRRFGAGAEDRVLVGLACGGTLLAIALLSTGPWRAPDGYVGHSYAIQLAALIALIAVAVSALRARL